MAAFPYQDTPFLLDSLYLSNTSSTKIKMPSLLEGGDINPCFSTYPSELLQEKTIDLRTHGSSCLNNNYCTTLGNTNEPLLTEISKTDSSSMVVELDGDDHKEPSVDKKRKNNDGSCLSSAQSQDTRRAKIKKQKKCSHRKEETEEKKSRSLMKKVVEEPPTGYIHVRARRGQATDSHSLAERVRREKISERMKLLQGLVPGCDKVSGKALMLDEIINYVQSLQYQVEFLSMKLASVDFGADLHANIIKSEPEKVSSRLGSALALQSSFMQQPTACYAAAAYTTTPATLTTKTSNYSVDEKDNAVSFQPQEQQGGQMLSEFSQEDNENLMIWDVYGYGQRQRLLLNQYDLNNLCSFH